MKLKRIHRDFSVCQVEDYSLVNLESEYCFIGKTDEERSLVCAESEVPSNVIKREDGWKAICICGVLDFSLIGILSEIAAVLADNAISIFAVSTYNTDYILIKSEDYQRGLEALKSEGYEITDRRVSACQTTAQPNRQPSVFLYPVQSYGGFSFYPNHIGCSDRFRA